MEYMYSANATEYEIAAREAPWTAEFRNCEEKAGAEIVKKIMVGGKDVVNSMEFLKLGEA
jgi:hypothetical protein